MGLLKVGEDINSVWENDRLWKILKVNTVCFYLMWWEGMKWGEKKKACLEWWARAVVTQWHLEGNREGQNCFLKERGYCQDMRRAWSGALDSMTDKKGYVRKREQRWHQLCHTDWDWRRGERRKASRLQEQSAALATVAGAERVRAEYVWERRCRVCSLRQISVEYLACHLEIYFLAVCDHCLQVYPHMPSTSLEGFVRNCRCWAVGEDCPGSPAIRACAFLCQHTVMLMDVTRKQILAFVAQTCFWWETHIPKGRVTINAQGGCSSWSLYCFFLAITLGVLYKSMSEVVKQSFFNYTPPSKLIRQTKQATK